MTRYYVLVAKGFMDQIDDSRIPEGFYFIERVRDMGPYTDMWLVEDSDAPEDLESKLIEPTFSVRPGRPDERAFISDRYVMETGYIGF